MSKNRVLTSLIAAIVSVVVGILLVAWPDQSRAFICYVIGALLVAAGVVSILRYFNQSDTEPIMRYGFATGVVLWIVGILVIARAGKLIAFFGIIIGILLVIDSVLRIQLALDIRRMGGDNWFPILISAIVVLIIALLLVFNPFTLVNTATIIAGIAAILNGLLKIWGLIQAKVLIRTLEKSEPVMRRVK